MVESLKVGIVGLHRYRALDMTLPGIVSEISVHQGNAPVAVPDFRFD